MNAELSAPELTTVLTRLHGMLLESAAATAAVAQLAEVARDLIPMATGAGVTLVDQHGQPRSTAATDPAVEALDRLQYELGEGPCLAAWDTVSLQRVDDTTTETRWPMWAKAAVATGLGSVLSTPLVFQGREVGAVKVYAGEPHAFTEHEEHLLGLLAGAAATLLGAAQDRGALDRLSTSLESTLADRQTIQLAVGMLMERHQLTRAEAHARLQAETHRRGIPAVFIAARVVGHADDPRL
ncbi:GAF and ANTAR domain-containing protein [Kocuria sp. NPDC057446]|uniref:GAF and ANTAR domain-containing protein n=1 Tax=Kocuria sp. NPDC057446 TaxID=3346137 RepID=UPI00368AEA74